MDFKQKLKEDLKKSILKNQLQRVKTLRLLLAEISKKEIEKRTLLAKKENIKEDELKMKSQLSREEIINLIEKEIKKREKAIEEFEKGKREDLISQEKSEIEILKEYIKIFSQNQDIKL
jgi:uncharacterized protein YqeY